MRLAMQIDNGTQVAAVQARNRFNNVIYIDPGYNVAKSAAALRSGARSIEITFIEKGTDRIIAASSLGVSVRRANGEALPTRMDRHEIFVVGNVPREALLVTVQDKDSGKTTTLNLFPYYIENETGTILCDVFDFPLGRGLAVDPDYAH